MIIMEIHEKGGDLHLDAYSFMRSYYAPKPEKSLPWTCRVRLNPRHPGYSQIDTAGAIRTWENLHRHSWHSSTCPRHFYQIHNPQLVHAMYTFMVFFVDLHCINKVYEH